MSSFHPQLPQSTTTEDNPQVPSGPITEQEMMEFGPLPYIWKAPSLSAPRETLVSERLPAMQEATRSASESTRLGEIIPPVKRMTFEGMGEFLKAILPDVLFSISDRKPSLENLYAAWRTEKLPIESQLEQTPGWGARGTVLLGNVVGSVPSLIGGGAIGKSLAIATAAPRLAMGAGYGAAMGSEAYSRSQGDWEQAFRSAAVGAVFPAVGQWAAKTGAAVSKFAVSTGVPLAERQTVQKAVEFGIEQAALQSFNHVVSTPEYLDIYSQGGADAVKQAILENTIALGVFAIPGIVRTLSPRFPSELARSIAQEASKDLDKAVKSTVEIPDFRKRLAEEQQKALEKAAALPAKPPVEPPKESEAPNAIPELGRSIVPEIQKAGGVPPLETEVWPPEARPVAGQAEAGVRQPSVTISPAVPGVQEPSIAETKPGETTGEPKQPWQMTREEHRAYFKAVHKAKATAEEIDDARWDTVDNAIRRGDPVPPKVLADFPKLKEVIPSETQMQGQRQVEQRPPETTPVAPTTAPEPGPPFEPTPPLPTPPAAQNPPKPAIVASPVAEAPKPPVVLNLGIPLEHRGGEVPETPQAKAGMKLLTKAISDLGDKAKRFTGIKFEKSTGFGLEVRSDDPLTLVIDPEQLHRSAKIIRARYRGGMKAALDEEVVHSFVHEVSNALEIVDPGFRERMAGEMDKKAIDEVRRIRGVKEGPVETALEFLRMKIQRKRSILTERFTRQLSVLDKYPITQTMRDLLGALGDFVQKIFGDKKPTALQSVYEASIKLMDEFERNQAQTKTAAGATEVQDYAEALKPKGKRITKWSPKQNAVVSEAMKDPKFAPWVAQLDQTLRPIVQSVSNGDEGLTQIAVDYLRYKKLPEWASHFQETGKTEVGNVALLLGKVRKLEEFKQRTAEIEGQAAIAPTEERPEGRQIASEALTPDEILARAEESAPAVGPQTPLESIVREFIQRREAKGVLDTDDILELKAAIEALGLTEKQVINAVRRIVTPAASPEELERQLKPIKDPRTVAAMLLGTRSRDLEQQILQETVASNVVSLDQEATKAFKALPPGAQAELPGVSDAVKVVEIAGANVSQRFATPPAEPYVRGQETPGPLQRWITRLAAPITDIQKKFDVIHSMLNAANESVRARTVDQFKIKQRFESVYKELIEASEKLSKTGSKVAKAQSLDDLADDLRENYLKVITNGITAARDRAALTGAEEVLASQYKHDLDVLKDQFRTEALRRSIVAAYDSLVAQNAIGNPAIGPKDIERLIIKAKPTDIPSDRLRLVAKMMGEYADLTHRLNVIKSVGLMPSSVFAGAHVKLLKDLQSAITPRAFLSMLNKYSSAQGKSKELWDAVKASQRQFQSKLEEATNLSLADDYLEKLVNSVDFRNRQAELGDIFDMTYNAIDNKSADGYMAKPTYKNFNPVPTDPDLAANYVKEVTVEPWREWTDAQAEDNLRKLMQVRNWDIEYLQNGKDPIKLRSAEQRLLKLNSLELNEEFLPRFKHAWKLAPVWLDIHRWPISPLHLQTAEYIGRFIPGRPGKMLLNALNRWSETRGRAASAINDFSAEAERLSDIAAKEHGMNLQDWIDNVNNPILSSYSAEALATMTKGMRLLESNIIVTAADIEAARANHQIFVESVKRGLPEREPEFAQEPLRIILDELETRRKAYGKTSLMVPRRFLREANGWAEEWMAKAQPAVDNPSNRWEIRWNQLSSDQQKGLLDFLNDRRRFKLVVMSHLTTTYLRPKYVIRSPLEGYYRDYVLKRIEYPDQFDVKTVQDLADKLVVLGASDQQGNPLSSSEIITILTGEINKAMTNLSQDVAKRAAADELPQLFKVQTADNFTTMPRGDLVAPEGMYDYSLATYNQHLGLYSQIQRPYFVRFISAIQQVSDSLAAEKKRMEDEARNMLPSGTPETQVARKAQTYSKAEMKVGNFWMDYNDVSRLEEWTRHLRDQTMAFAEDYSGKLNEALLGYSIASRAMTAAVLGQESAIIRNRLGQPLIATWRSYLRGQNEIPFAGSAGVNNLFDFAERPPVAGDALRAGVRTPRDMLRFLSAIKTFVLRVAGDRKWGQDFIKSVKKNPTAWSQWAAETANAMEYAQTEFADAVRLGIVTKANVWNTLRNIIRFPTEGGHTGTELPTFRRRVMGTLKSIGQTFTNTILLGPTITWTESSANRAAAQDARDTIAWLEYNIAAASGNRAMAGVDPALTRLTVQEIYKSRRATEKQLAWLKEDLGPAIKLDYVALRYIKQLQEARAKGQPLDQVHLLTDGEMDSFMVRTANKQNRQTWANRPPALKNRIAHFFSQLWGYTTWLTQEFSFARAKLMSDERKFDPSFISTRMLLYTMMFGAATVPLFDWLAEHWKGKSRAIPSLKQAGLTTDLLPVALMQSQGFMPLMLQFAAGIPSSFNASKYNINTGVSILPMQQANNAFNWMKTMVQTHDVYRPTVRFLSQVIPNTQYLVNNFVGLEFMGSRAVQDVKLELGKAGVLAHVEMPPTSIGQYAGRLTPVSPVIDRLVNYMNNPVPDWNKVMEIRSEAMSMLMDKGETDPENTVNRMVLSRAPMQSKFGRQLSISELAAIESKMSPTAMEKTQQVESNFAQYAALTGSPAPAALTMPKPSRKDMPVGGGATYAGGGNGGGPAVGFAGDMPSAAIGGTLTRPSTALAGPRTRRARLGRVRGSRVSIRRPATLARPSLRRRMVRVVARKRFRLR